MSITVAAGIDSSGAADGASKFNEALASMRSEVAKTGDATGGLGDTFGKFSEDVRAHLGLADGVIVGIGAHFGEMIARVIEEIPKVVGHIIELSDHFTELKARIEGASAPGSNIDGLIDALTEAATKAETPFTTLATLYQKNAAALQELGFTQAQGVQLATTLAEAVKISGLSGDAASAAFAKLSAVLTMNQVPAGEFRNLASQMPVLLKAIEDQTGLTAAQLRKMANDGRISGETLASAILNASDQIQQRFQQMPATVSDSWGLLMSELSTSFAKMAEQAGVSKTWASAIDEIRKALNSGEVQTLAKGAADGVVLLGNSFQSLIETLKDAKYQYEAWAKVLSDNTVYRDLVAAVDFLKFSFQGLKLLATDVYDFALKPLGKSIYEDTPLGGMAAQASALVEQLKAVDAWQTKVTKADQIQGAGQAAAKVPIPYATNPELLKQAQKLLEVEQLKAQITQAEIDEQPKQVEQLKAELDMRSRISDKIKQQFPDLTLMIEATMRQNQELAKQKTIHDELKSAGEQFATTLGDAFTNGIKNGENFGQVLKDMASKLLDMTVQLTVMKPLVESLGKSFASSFQGTDLASVFSKTAAASAGSTGGLFSAFGFADGTVIDSPTRFNYGGSPAVMGESGPEAIMPLVRGPGGSLGVASVGGGNGGNTYVTVNVAGDATDATVAKIRNFWLSDISRSQSSTVAASVSAVQAQNLRDPTYLRR